MDVELPDGTVVEGVPEGTSRRDLATKLRASGREVPESWLAKDEPKDGVFGNAVGQAEGALAVLSSPIASLAGNVAGALRSMTGGKYGTQEGVQQGIEAGNKVADALTYAPRTKTGQQVVQDIAKMMDDWGISALPPTLGNEVPRVGALGKASARQMEEDVARSFEQAPKPAPAMPGVGAAETDIAKMRRERAASLPVPIKLSKGQATRDFEQQRFERETAKDSKIGQPLREHFAENNEQILANFDAWLDQTGATAPDLYNTGQAVDKALVQKANRAKAQVNAAYTKAREAGEMESKVPTDQLVAWVQQNASKARNAPVISTIEDELVRLNGASRQGGALKPGLISINDMEELRKTINEVMGQDPTNKLFGSRGKAVIDQITDGRGGQLYKDARAKRMAYAKEFEDRGIVAKLLRTKPGTEDRAVALENVFNHSVLASSQDDLRFLEKTLKEGGEAGEQAWREVQGQTVQYIKQVATKASARDVKGNPIISPAALDRAVTNLDRQGKLEIIFGKQGAQAMRDINDLAKDVYTAPPGSVNTSGTTSTLLEAMSHVPYVGKYPAIAKGLVMAKKKLQERRVKQRVKASLEQPE